MSQIQKKFLAANAVDQSKIRLSNNSFLRARNAADSADVNLLKLNASDRIEFASIPQVSSDPSAANDLVRKAYVDAVAEGLKPKEAVRAATTGPITIATALNSGDSIDGVTLADGDRVLVKDQASASENGIYIVGASPARSSDFDSLTPIDEINGAYVAVQEGSVNQGKLFVQSGNVATLNTDPITFVFFNSAGTLSGGDGIDISGAIVSVDHDGQGFQFSAGQLSLELDGSTLSKSASGLKVADLGIGSGQLAANAVTTAKIANDAVDKDKIAPDVAGNGLGQNVDGSLEVKVDDSTVEINSDQLRVKDAGIVEAKLASDSVSTAKIQNLAVTEAKIAASAVSTAKIANDAVDKDKIAADVAGAGLGQNVDGSLEVNVDNSTIEINADSLRVKDAGITNAKVATGIDAAKIADGSVSNAEFQYINSLTSNAQDQLDNKQPLDATLTSLAAYNTNGFLVQTAADTFAGRTLVAGTGISITNADGVAGNPTINSTVSAYTDEQAQDAVGGILVDSATIDFTYDDGAPSITAIVIDASITEAKLASDSVSTAKIVNANVTEAKLASDSVSTAKIQNSAVTTAKIANDAVDKDKIAADVAGNGLAQNVDGSLEINLAASSGLEIATDQLKAKVDDATIKINGSNQLESLKFEAQQITLVAGDITAQYIDLAYTAHSAASIALSVVGGIMQERGVDYTVSLSGGAGGVTRLTFAGDLQTGGAAELISGDKLIVQYARL